MSNEKYSTTDAIILKYQTFREIDRNFTFISPTIGIQQATAFGAEKLKSRFCSVVQPFVKTKLFLSLSQKKDLYKLDDVAEVDTNDFLRKDLHFIYLSSFYVDVFLNTFMSSEEYKSFYHLLLYSFEVLKEKKDLKKSFLFFVTKFLILSGYGFHLSNCRKCGELAENYFFDLKKGGIFCYSCAESKNITISSKTSLLWKDFFEKRFIFLKEDVVDKEDFFELFPIILEIFKNIFEKELKTIPILKEIF